MTKESAVLGIVALLEEKRATDNLSQIELALQLNLGTGKESAQTMYSRIKHGTAAIPIARLPAISKFLGIPILELTHLKDYDARGAFAFADDMTTMADLCELLTELDGADDQEFPLSLIVGILRDKTKCKGPST